MQRVLVEFCLLAMGISMAIVPEACVSFFGSSLLCPAPALLLVCSCAQHTVPGTDGVGVAVMISFLMVSFLIVVLKTIVQAACSYASLYVVLYTAIQSR